MYYELLQNYLFHNDRATTKTLLNKSKIWICRIIKEVNLVVFMCDLDLN